MRILVTDVTRLGKNFCVAGWDAEGRRMVRPLPHGETFGWPPDLLARHGVAGGAVVQFAAAPLREPTTAPHAREDCGIDPHTIRLMEPAPGEWRLPNPAPPAAGTVRAALQGTLRFGRFAGDFKALAHVPEGRDGPSLGAVSLPADCLSFAVNKRGKLRARLHDGHMGYSLPVVCHALRSVFEEGGLAALAGLLPGDARLHVRLGLARAMDVDGKRPCYLMLNRVYW